LLSRSNTVTVSVRICSLITPLRHGIGKAIAPIAKAFGGLTDREIEEMTEYFKGIAREQHGRSFLIEPKVVVELKFDEIQKSSLYGIGYALRFPRIKRIRWDLSVDEIDSIDPVERIFKRQKRSA